MARAEDHRIPPLVIQIETERTTIVGTRRQLNDVAGAIAQAIARGDGSVLLDGRTYTLRCWDPIAPRSTRETLLDDELPPRPKAVGA